MNEVLGRPRQAMEPENWRLPFLEQLISAWVGFRHWTPAAAAYESLDSNHASKKFDLMKTVTNKQCRALNSFQTSSVTCKVAATKSEHQNKANQLANLLSL